MQLMKNDQHALGAAMELEYSKLLDTEQSYLESRRNAAIASRPGKEEIQIISHQAAQLANNFGLNLHADDAKVKDLRLKRFKIFKESMDRAKVDLKWIPLPPDPLPQPIDSSFWWARTDWYPDDIYTWGEVEIKSSWQDGVLRFSGFRYKNDGNLSSGSFGATALFELQPNRTPKSPSGRFRSTPTVDIGGEISGHTEKPSLWHPFDGDKWSKCWMYRRQRIFQNGLGGQILLGEKTDQQTLFFHENGGSTDFVLPGAQAMPAIDFAVNAPAESVWAQLEVRFDYQVEGDGAYISFTSAPITLQFRQWLPQII